MQPNAPPNHSSTRPYAVGTPNATQDVYRHIKPGRHRANFFRYFRFNLPRLTKALVIAVIATIGGSAGIVATGGMLPFTHADVPLWIIVVSSLFFIGFTLISRRAIWDYGMFIASGAIITYVGSVLYGVPPFVWNGASIPLAASFNLMLFASLGYGVLVWAINMRILVVWPDDQGFTD